jgi:hypothetical protein
MNLISRLFKRPTPTDAGRILSELACLKGRERVKARARLMRVQLGLPEKEALR